MEKRRNESPTGSMMKNTSFVPEWSPNPVNVEDQKD